MNKFKYYFILVLASIAIVSCNKDNDDPVVVPVHDYAEQYKADNDSIVKYLNTNYITVTNSPGTPEDQDVVISKITNPATQPSIMSYLNSATFPKLLTRDVYNDDITYKVYYLVLREGSGEAPTNTDRISASYSGNLLNGTVFDTSYGIGRTFDLFVYAESPVIDGWGEIFPKFRTGIASDPSPTGEITYSDFGAGVMFLPSGLGYYANTKDKIPAYSPLVFSFKLLGLQRLDHDIQIVNGQATSAPDGIPDYFEDINHDGYLYDARDTARYPNLPAALVDDTDKDGLADFLDFDDDGDGYTTRFEITKPTGAPKTGISLYYPYNPVSDNPKTPNVDETETYGIPAFGGDYTTPDRLRLHIDKDHHAVK
ncbi:FKBP-type peptidyl-prolyl cis-trans isomerase [Flavobacterium sp. MR2016-29]|uniref:FKBP-type peptidyl-prolyl cis-trans isomerase n=1 Tax=Flavobacterium sp. MR2016-29 TaxID=2783795 RepID=UPI00188C52EC|nr:FKBP-type peptidyl-prolyl cis-trans isomerase [Flavobacterium sp. MR2016-29]MBF4492643.1 FKBP-type peptidyl-prolyl cis-trans isomerase [Flavobacterium sp. MR2016-29]